LRFFYGVTLGQADIPVHDRCRDCHARRTPHSIFIRPVPPFRPRPLQCDTSLAPQSLLAQPCHSSCSRRACSAPGADPRRQLTLYPAFPPQSRNVQLPNQISESRFAQTRHR
jgi:hypothetical protein